MLGLLNEGNQVWISKVDDPKRKLKFTLEMIKSNKKIIGVNTHRANRIVEHGLKNKLLDEFSSININPNLNILMTLGLTFYVINF